MTQRRVLLIDDDPLLREFAVAHLEDAGLLAIGCHTGVAGLSMLEQASFDLVLLDLNMPGMDGLDVITAIRQHPTAHSTPIAVLSARHDEATVAEAFARGARDVIRKPITAELLVRRVKNQMGPIRPTGPIMLTDSIIIDRTSFCPMCDTVTKQRESNCSQCGLERPPSGWTPLHNSKHPMLGETLDNRYYLKQYVGSGVSGAVYRGRDTRIGRDLAVKIVSIHSDDAKQRLLLTALLRQEISASATLSSPHIVRIWDVINIDDNTAALLMDYIDGTTLQELVKRFGRMNVEEAIRSVRQVALALADAHRYGVIHRDIKPANIMIQWLPNQTPFVRVLDFGVSCVRGAQDAETKGLVFGTPAYASPEQLRGKDDIDHRADIYALGCLLYFCLVGRRPFSGKDWKEVAIQQVQKPLPALPEAMTRNVALREILDQIIAKATEKDPARRYQTSLDFLRALEVDATSAMRE